MYQFLVTMCCAAMSALAVSNFLFIRREAKRAKMLAQPDPAPKISVCVPARNEARNIETCVESLARQNYPNFEILVLDDQSEDNTAAIAREVAFRHPHLIRVIEGEPLPADWIGKSWACDQMSRATGGEYLLFTDADTVWAPHALDRIIKLAIDGNADLFSAPPRLDAVTIWERLSVPMLTLAGATMLSLPLIAHPAMKDYAIASGACLLFRREAYDRIDGHRGVRAQIVEDLELARRAKRCKLKLLLTDGSRLVRCRMYRSRREVWEGFTKNFSKSFGAPLTPLVLVATLAIFFGPVFSLLFGSAMGWGLWAATLLPLAQIVTLMALRAATEVTMKTFSWSGYLLTPLAALFVVAIGLRSWSRTLLRQPTPWRNRHYEMWHRNPARLRHR